MTTFCISAYESYLSKSRTDLSVVIAKYISDQKAEREQKRKEEWEKAKEERKKQREAAAAAHQKPQQRWQQLPVAAPYAGPAF
jgi:hypothetical protein